MFLTFNMAALGLVGLAAIAKRGAGAGSRGTSLFSRFGSLAHTSAVTADADVDAPFDLGFSVIDVDYGVLENTISSRAYYGYEHVVEPYHDVKLELRDNRTVAAVEEAGSVYRVTWTIFAEKDESAPDVITGPVVDSFECTTAGAEYSVTLELGHKAKGTVVASARSTISCRYVRRELRSLSDADREKYIAALQVIYSMGLEEGQAKYGKDFKNYRYFAALHDDPDYCYHFGPQFFTSHPALQLKLEEALHSIDPSISHPYWDFMIDSAVYGTSWPYHAEPFRNTWFGRLNTSEADNFVLTEGPFAYTKIATDFNYTYNWTTRNAFGLITAPRDEFKSWYIQRSNTFCGKPMEQLLPSCDAMVACFEQNSDFSHFDLCVERNVHANLHNWPAGAWGCNDDFTELHAKDPTTFPSGLLDFIGIFSFQGWYLVSENSWADEHNVSSSLASCPNPGACAMTRSEKDCKCSCDVDVYNLTEAVLYEGYVNPLMADMSTEYQHNKWISPTGSSEAGKPHYTWNHLSTHAEQTAFNRWFMDFLCHVGYNGQATTLAAPNDPYFWVVHPIFDRMLHLLRLSPTLRASYNFTWVPTDTCTGSDLEDKLPFSMPGTAGLCASERHCTNAELWEILDPSNAHLPYIYDSLAGWGDCSVDWDHVGH